MYAVKDPTHIFIWLEERLNLNRKYTWDALLSQISCHANKLPRPVTFVVTLLFWACPVKRRHAKFIQTTKKLLAVQSQSAVVSRAGSFAGVDVRPTVVLGQTAEDSLQNMPGYRAFFVPAVSENLLCRICHLPVRNAVQVSVCGHRFCDSCLNGAFSNTR